MQHFGQSIFTFCRSHFLKILFGLLFCFLVVQYVTNVVVFSVHFPRQYFSNFSPVLTSDNILGWTNEIDDLITTNSTGTSIELAISTTVFITNIITSTTVPTISVENKVIELPQCTLVPPNLVGALKVLTDVRSFRDLENMFQDLKPGGRFSPKDCSSRNRVALIIPYRNREEHLHIFLHNLHPMLMRQQLDYGIYVVEQFGNTTFNRAMLMNIGYVEALKQYDYQCFIFHDVDLIPEDDRNLYTCPQQPRHMSVAIDSMGYRLPYQDIFGGVCALTKEQMENVNGFSNEYWGWGGEDDDMFGRVTAYGYKITRYPASLARYKMIRHQKDKANKDRYKLLQKATARYKTDGLVNLKYRLRSLVKKKLYTWLLVEIAPL